MARDAPRGSHSFESLVDKALAQLALLDEIKKANVLPPSGFVEHQDQPPVRY